MALRQEFRRPQPFVSRCSADLQLQHSHFLPMIGSRPPPGWKRRGKHFKKLQLNRNYCVDESKVGDASQTSPGQNETAPVELQDEQVANGNPLQSKILSAKSSLRPLERKESGRVPAWAIQEIVENKPSLAADTQSSINTSASNPSPPVSQSGGVTLQGSRRPEFGRKQPFNISPPQTPPTTELSSIHAGEVTTTPAAETQHAPYFQESLSSTGVFASNVYPPLQTAPSPSTVSASNVYPPLQSSYISNSSNLHLQESAPTAHIPYPYPMGAQSPSDFPGTSGSSDLKTSTSALYPPSSSNVTSISTELKPEASTLKMPQPWDHSEWTNAGILPPVNPTGHAFAEMYYDLPPDVAQSLGIPGWDRPQEQVLEEVVEEELWFPPGSVIGGIQAQQIQYDNSHVPVIGRPSPMPIVSSTATAASVTSADMTGAPASISSTKPSYTSVAPSKAQTDVGSFSSRPSMKPSMAPPISKTSPNGHTSGTNMQSASTPNDALDLAGFPPGTRPSHGAGTFASTSNTRPTGSVSTVGIPGVGLGISQKPSSVSTAEGKPAQQSVSGTAGGRRFSGAFAAMTGAVVGAATTAGSVFSSSAKPSATASSTTNTSGANATAVHSVGKPVVEPKPLARPAAQTTAVKTNSATSLASSEAQMSALLRPSNLPFKDGVPVETTSQILAESKYKKTTKPQASASLSTDPAALAKYLENARKSNDPRVQREFAKYLLATAKRSEPPKADSFGKDAAEKISAQVALETQRQDLLKEAEFWIDGLAKKGDSEACYIKGTWFELGELGKPKSLDAAFDWYMLGTKGNHAPCSWKVGWIYEGKGEKQKALQYYKRAAQLNDPAANYVNFVFFSES